MFQLKQQQQQKKKNRLMLICVTVLGSAGPIRLVVDEDEPVVSVIGAALKSYARQGRLPVLGSDLSGFLLYCPNDSSTGADSLSPLDTIGSQRARSFILYKKPSPSAPEPLMMRKSVRKEKPASASASASAAAVSCRGGWISKSWIKRRVSDEQTLLSFSREFVGKMEGMGLVIGLVLGLEAHVFCKVQISVKEPIFMSHFEAKN